MDSTVHRFTYPDGTTQRVQLVRLTNWDSLEFLNLKGTPEALDCFERIYRKHLVPACPWIFGRLRLFREAASGDCREVRGKLPFRKNIPVGDNCGFLSEETGDFLVNSSFFIMDPFDCATGHDRIGTPLGLMVKDGKIENPPLYGREALLVDRDGKVEIRSLGPENLTIEIGGREYSPGDNCRVFQRPRYPFTPPGKGLRAVIIGCRVAAVGRGILPVPASGFVLEVPRDSGLKAGDPVAFRGLENCVFGIQVGNSVMRNGVPTDRFLSRFYNIRALQPVPFPPSLYPMDFEKGRAARMVLGADRAGKPMVLWAEGAPKTGYVPGRDSRGASLSELARLCADLGFYNAVNLDGGGSAQILVEGRRELRISDRDQQGREVERPIPAALRVKFCLQK